MIYSNYSVHVHYNGGGYLEILPLEKHIITYSNILQGYTHTHTHIHTHTHLSCPVWSLPPKDHVSLCKRVRDYGTQLGWGLCVRRWTVNATSTFEPPLTKHTFTHTHTHSIHPLITWTNTPTPSIYKQFWFSEKCLDLLAIWLWYSQYTHEGI